MDGGYVKLYRKSIESRVFTNADLWKVWCWCLMRANHKPTWVTVKTGRGESEVFLQPGQFIFGRKTAAKKLRMKQSSIRNRIEKLKNIGNLENQPNTNYTIIKILNWDTYNQSEKKEDSKEDNQRTTKGQPKDTDKNDKNDKKKEKKERKEREYPDWLILKSWDEYKQHRKEIKSPLSELAEKKAINKLKTFIDLGFDQVEVIDQSIENGWKGLFEVKNSKHKIADIKPTTYAQKQDAERRGRAAWLLKEMEDEKNSEGTDKTIPLLSSDPLHK